MEGHWKFRGGGGSQQPKFIRESIKLNCKFLGGGRVQPKKNFHGGGMEIFWNHTIQNKLIMEFVLSGKPSWGGGGGG